MYVKTGAAVPPLNQQGMRGGGPIGGALGLGFNTNTTCMISRRNPDGTAKERKKQKTARI